MAMSLMDYVSSKNGSWTSQASGNVIELTRFDDAVVFQGPLSLNVAVVAEAVLSPVAGGDARTSTSDLYSYDVEVPAGYTWRYQMADSPAGQRVSGFKVLIRATHCVHRTPVQAPDLPCDFAVGNLTNVGQFFPIGCEPCGTGPVRLPPTCGPSLAVMPASGGCVRPRFFNGMNITREDLETQLRYLRLKNQLQRRADGEGVVWGLGVGRDGSSVCVQPGYAVDYCGNDLVVTLVYKVDTATLLSDPAICNQITGHQQCMSLLLEYVECPEQPRPIHGGDPCSNMAAGCEMSRVRETVRLRLVPTRDYQPKGPIQRFLEIIGQGQANVPAPQPAAGGGTTTPQSTVPFNIHVHTTDQPQFSFNDKQIDIQPLTTAPTTQSIQLRATNSTQVTITLPSSGSAFFSAGSVRAADAATPVPNNVQIPKSGVNSLISWLCPTVPGPTETYTYVVDNWAAPAPSGGTSSGTTTISLATSINELSEFKLNITVAPTQVSLSTPAATSFPCLTDPCCGSTPQFPVTPPWADANPFRPDQAGDLNVIGLAVLYILAAGTAAQNSPDASGFAALYQQLLKTVDPNATTSDIVNRDTQALQQLLADLCCSLLYPGPECHGEPHGVVIGCAMISGREIERVDAWSGRRWVMHYPLLSYWRAQFGIVPPDVLASRLFSFICCAAGLKPPSFAVNQVNLLRDSSIPQEVPVGAGRLVVNPAPAAAGTATETASLPMFAARILSALAGQPAPEGTPMIDVALAGNPAIRLLVPNPAAAASPQAGTGQQATPVINQVQTAFAAPELRAAVPPLLRSFAASLGANLIDVLPLTNLNPPANVLRPMTAAGIASIGALLARTPDSLYQTVLGRTQATELSNLLTGAEARPAEVARSVAEALTAVAARHTLVSPDDLASAEAQAALAEPLAEALHLPVATVTAAITRTLR